jgi:hypothetical protein
LWYIPLSCIRYHPMGLKVYCNRYTHFKDTLVCSVNCIYRTKCDDFALFYDQHREEIDQVVDRYLRSRRVESSSPNHMLTSMPTASDVAKLFSLEVKKIMADNSFIWIGLDDKAELIEFEDVLRRAEAGEKSKHIFKIAQEMELKFQLVPRKRIEKAKTAAANEAERAAARQAKSGAAKAEAGEDTNRPRPRATKSAITNQ